MEGTEFNDFSNIPSSGNFIYLKIMIIKTFRKLGKCLFNVEFKSGISPSFLNSPYLYLCYYNKRKYPKILLFSALKWLNIEDCFKTIANDFRHSKAYVFFIDTLMIPIHSVCAFFLIGAL